MNKLFLIAILLCSSLYAVAQENEKISLLQTDSTWGKEIIEIPFWFAPDIKYNGYEDIRFAKGWAKVDSPGFWTSVFAWDLNLKTKPTVKFFEDNLKLYFDGLMKVVNEDTLLTILKTKAKFKEINKGKKATTFAGTVETYDAFTTKKMITLNVTIEIYYCTITKNFMPLVRFSPKDYKHKAWKMLSEVKLDQQNCALSN